MVCGHRPHRLYTDIFRSLIMAKAKTEHSQTDNKRTNKNPLLRDSFTDALGGSFVQRVVDFELAFEAGH
jgi:hypothetical protein